MDKGKTLISKSKKVVPIGKEETLMLLRAYQNHPCVWSEIVEELRDNIEKLLKEAQEIYRNKPIKKTERQARGKLRKLMAAKTADNDSDICIEVERVKKLETKLQDKVEAAVRGRTQGAQSANSRPLARSLPQKTREDEGNAAG